MKKITLLLAAAAAFVSTTASAQPLMQYNYLDVAYQWNDTKGISGLRPTNGLDTKLSVSPIDNFALEGGYNYAKGDLTKTVQSELEDFIVTGAGSINFNTWTYGVLGYYSLCDGLDLLARVGGNHYNENFSIAGNKFSGGADRIYAGVGARYLATEDLEIDGNILYQDQDRAVWTYSSTALYAVHQNVALKGDVGIDDNSNVTLTAGVRLAM